MLSNSGEICARSYGYSIDKLKRLAHIELVD